MLMEAIAVWIWIWDVCSGCRTELGLIRIFLASRLLSAKNKAAALTVVAVAAATSGNLEERLDIRGNGRQRYLGWLVKKTRDRLLHGSLVCYPSLPACTQEKERTHPFLVE